MYPMPEFQERDLGVVVDFVRQHSLGMVTGIGEDGGVVATHVPLLVQFDGEKVVLRGHLMRKTAYWRGFTANPSVLVAFTGPDAPVISSWLEEPLNFGGTWSYMAVHMRGELAWVSPEQTVDILRDLKDTYETDPEAKFDKLPESYVSALVPAIEGFEIRVTDIQAVFKLGQNRTPADYDRIVAALREQGGEAALVSGEMELRRESYFSASPTP